MCKVNFATELRAAYTDAGKKLLEEKPEAVKELVKGRMKVLGCEGKAR